MLGIGTSLRVDDFTRVFYFPAGIITGLVSQILFLPVLALIISFLWPMDPIYKAGLVLVAACPGGSSSNLITHLLKGRTALSVSMTALNSLLILFSLPFLAELALDIFLSEAKSINLPYLDTMLNVFYTVVLPVFLGVVINKKFPDFSAGMQRPLKYIMPLLLLIAFVYVIFFNPERGADGIDILDKLPLLLPALLLNVSGMFVGYFSGRAMRLSRKSHFTLAIEIGLQNSALAIYVANDLIGNAALSDMAVVYASFTFFSTIGIAWLMKRADEKRERENR